MDLIKRWQDRKEDFEKLLEEGIDGDHIDEEEIKALQTMIKLCDKVIDKLQKKKEDKEK